MSTRVEISQTAFNALEQVTTHSEKVVNSLGIFIHYYKRDDGDDVHVYQFFPKRSGQVKYFIEDINA